MGRGEYIPLAQTPFETLAISPPRSAFTRRRVIIGGLVALGLLGLYFVAASVLDDSGDEDDYIWDLVSQYHGPYLPFKAQKQDNAQWPSAQQLPGGCLDAYMSSGSLCYSPEIQPLDVVWTWVNGSDMLLRENKLEVENAFEDDDPYRPKTSSRQARQYREHEELKHSIRSVLANYRPHTTQLHVVASDFSIPLSMSNLTLPNAWRLGQVPQWLNITEPVWVDGNITLSFIHHADIFTPYNHSIFNSYAIESQFAHLQGVSEHFIYLNDDFYMSNPLTPRSFYTSPYGIVLRFDTTYLISPEKPGPEETRSEWKSMGESNYLLSERFGARHRPYVLHEAKTVSYPMLWELSHMWLNRFNETAQHAFRETVGGAGDVYTLFMMNHFIVERWREALLWSWVVARNGGVDDEWDSARTALAWKELGGTYAEHSFTVQAGYRQTLDEDIVEANLQASGYQDMDETEYIFSSLDGYPYMYIDWDNRDWPWFTDNTTQEGSSQCTISFQECFTDGSNPFTSASSLFKHIAFRKTQCGDCAIQALVRASGPLGLEAFLPSQDRHLDSLGWFSHKSQATPHLPLVDRWVDADFSIKSVIGASEERNLRNWTLRLLERYRFTIGSTPHIFVMLTDPSNAQGQFDMIDERENLSLICINDDIESEGDEVNRLFVEWQEKRWGAPAAWEQEDV